MVEISIPENPSAYNIENMFFRSAKEVLSTLRHLYLIIIAYVNARSRSYQHVWHLMSTTSNFECLVLSAILADSNETLHTLRYMFKVQTYTITLDINQ